MGNVAEWRDGFLGMFQICCLAVFFAIVVGRAMSLRIRSRVNPITLRVRKRGLLGAVELAQFAQVNLWAAAVVVYSLPWVRRPDSWMFRGALVDSIWAKIEE